MATFTLNGVDARDLALQASCPVLAAPRFGPLPPMDNGQRIIVAANGLFVQVRLDWLDCIQRLAPVTGFPLPYGEVQEQMAFAFGRLPIHLIEQFIAIGRERLPDETAGALVYSRASASLRLVLHSPVMSSPDHIIYGVPSMATDESLAVDLHTHGRQHAFWSATDDRDDIGIKIAGVFGNLHRQQPSAEFRLVLNGLYRALPHPWESVSKVGREVVAPATWPDLVEDGILRRILVAIRRKRCEWRRSDHHDEEGNTMAKWNVYMDGKYVGTVQAISEEDARCYVLSEFDFPEDAEMSVSRR